jgi:hypothetical protein
MICSYELALLAKEKGFDRPVLHYYDKGRNVILARDFSKNFNEDGLSAPTCEELQEWLERRGWDICIDIGYTLAGEWNYTYIIYKDKRSFAIFPGFYMERDVSKLIRDRKKIMERALTEILNNMNGD